MISGAPTDPFADDEVLAAAERAGRAVVAVHRLPGNLRNADAAAAAAAGRAARCSALLDGASAGAAVRPGDDDGRSAGTPVTVDDPVLAGALRVAAALPALEAVWRRAPAQALARLHVLAAAGLVPAAELGRPRTGEPAALPLPAAVADAFAPPATAVPAGLAALSGLVLGSPWPAVLTVAVVHAELLRLRPFGAADGVVARAAARLTMTTTGLDPRGLTVPEAGHLRERQEYAAAARAWSAGTPDGRRRWLLHACAAMIAGAREGRSSTDATASAD
ncbi:hypothetical protein [Nakamurella endophytica]|uniref:Fido domain-containing protein n=1 Tax=Nakamurella endophytica TaxID=1748367 RepID=A0A917T1X2_9ACTN|nr:hypothetical protein [Nakamurella endophytica]GGM05365.1 hypothetical protein GCM10011594_27000 [Nakamurella endophytica]